MLKEPKRAAAQGLPNCNVIAFPALRNSSAFQPLDEFAETEIEPGEWEDVRKSARAAILLCRLDSHKVDAFMRDMVENSPQELQALLEAHQEHIDLLHTMIAALDLAWGRMTFSLDRINARRGAR
jgi:hypothetical protein